MGPPPHKRQVVHAGRAERSVAHIALSAQEPVKKSKQTRDSAQTIPPFRRRPGPTLRPLGIFSQLLTNVPRSNGPRPAPGGDWTNSDRFLTRSPAGTHASRRRGLSPPSP